MQELCGRPAFRHPLLEAPGHIVAGCSCIVPVRMPIPLPSIRSSSDPLDLRASSRDLWPLRTLDAWKGRSGPQPERVFWPSTPGEVHQILQCAQREGIAVVPYGAGSGVCGAIAPNAGSWVLDTKGLAWLGPLDRDRWCVRAASGVIGQHLEDWLAHRGMTLGHSPSSIGCSSVGGWAAARSAGQFSSRYGAFEDMVLGLEAVAPNPGVFRIGEEGDAPDGWLDLLLGSEGTLAVVTEALLRVWPAPNARWLRGYRFGDIGTALQAMRRLMQGELHPAVVRLYDPVDTWIGGRTRPRPDSHRSATWWRRLLSSVDQLPGVRQRSLAMPLALPRLINRVFAQAASGCLLIVGWEGEAGAVDVLSRAGHRILVEQGQDLGEGPGQRWYDSRHAVSYKLMPIFERGGFADTMEVAARWSEIERVYLAVREAVAPFAFVMAHMSHVYPEGASIYFSFAAEGKRTRYQKVWEVALEAALGAGATVSHHHGVGRLKAAHASKELGLASQGWRALKRELDPAGILNPGHGFGDGDHRHDAGPLPSLHPEDGLARSLVKDGPTITAASMSGGGSEPMWPWERFPGPPRWHRNPWQTSWNEVAATTDGVRCRLGRGPRSAVGPDLRHWLSRQPGAFATWPVAPPGDRWMGRVRREEPWATALGLLRADFRPAILTVDDGWLYLGFRGPAAGELGTLASGWLDAAPELLDWRPFPLPAGPFERCDPSDPACIHVTVQGTFRLARTGSDA